MRNSPSRTRDAIKNGKGKKSIVVCLPAIDGRVGWPFMGPSSVSATATCRAVDVLRREVRVAALTGDAGGMSDIEVVSLEVGELDIPPFVGRRMLDYDPKEYTKSWTPSEKLAYGRAWEFALRATTHDSPYKVEKVDLFVNDLVQIVSYGRVCSISLCGLRLHVGSVFGWLRGGRYAVGSGAGVMSSVISQLPGALLDMFVTSPYYMLSLYRAIVGDEDLPPATPPELPPAPAPVPASRPLPPRPLPTPPAAPAPALVAVAAAAAKETVDSAPSSEHEHEREASENGSEADVESNDGAGVSESWISLQPNPTMASSETIAAVNA